MVGMVGYYPGTMVGIHPSLYMPTLPPGYTTLLLPLSCPAVHHSLRGTLPADSALGSTPKKPLGGGLSPS